MYIHAHAREKQTGKDKNTQAKEKLKGDIETISLRVKTNEQEIVKTLLASDM